MPLKHQDYPEFKRDETCATSSHGYSIPDPYRWLEDPESEETNQFVEQQNQLVNPIIDSYVDREKIEGRLTELYDYERFGCPMKRGDFYYYFHNSGLQNQPVLYRTKDLASKGEVFLDPNTFSADGTTSINSYTFSEGGALFAYSVSEAGSDWTTIYVKDTVKNEVLPDKLERVKFSSLKFTKDAKGLFYNRYPLDGSSASGTSTVANKFHTLYYHMLGQKQVDDFIMAKFPDFPDYMAHVSVSEDGRYLFLAVSESCDTKCLFWYYDLEKVNYELSGVSGSGGDGSGIEWVKVFDNMDAEYQYVFNFDRDVILLTNKDAPKWRVVKMNLDDPEYKLTDLVSECEHVIDHVSPMADGNMFIINYIMHVVDTLFIYDSTTWSVLKKLDSGISAVNGISARHDSHELFFRVCTFVTPGTIYRVDLNDSSFTPELWREMKLKNVNQNDFTSNQVFYSSKDGTKVPMFITHKKGIDITSGSNVTLVYGYGGFNVALGPTFSPFYMMFMQHFNGIFCQTNIRGGSEYGEDWHTGGMKLNKQNVFDDFVAAAEYMIENKYTNPSRLISLGGSNGGLLTAACMCQRPDVYGVVLCQVGVLDMLRFHLFTIGAAWQSDFGYPDDNKEHFQYLLTYSPLHNIKMPPKGQLPAFLALTADHDDRVSPLHTLKFMATLQHEANKYKERQTNPLMAMIDTKAGHGAGKPTAKVIEERSRMMSFCAKHLDINFMD